MEWWNVFSWRLNRNYYCNSIIFSKKHNQLIQFIFLDLVALSAPIGIFFGRIANFINSELYGRETDVPWSVKFISNR